jgi:MOSC domain-containing protein YiiM
VEAEGEVGEGDSFELISRSNDGITIAEMNQLYIQEKYNRDLLQKAIATAALPEDWREYFLPRLNGLRH